MPQVNRDGASSRGSDASVAERSPGRQRRVQMRGRHTSTSRTALYHVVQGRPATSRDRKAIGIVKAQRDRPGGPGNVSMYCATVRGRYSSSVGGTSTGWYVNIFLRIDNASFQRDSRRSSSILRARIFDQTQLVVAGHQHIEVDKMQRSM